MQRQYDNKMLCAQTVSGELTGKQFLLYHVLVCEASNITVGPQIEQSVILIKFEYLQQRLSGVPSDGRVRHEPVLLDSRVKKQNRLPGSFFLGFQQNELMQINKQRYCYSSKRKRNHGVRKSVMEGSTFAFRLVLVLLKHLLVGCHVTFHPPLMWSSSHRTDNCLFDFVRLKLLAIEDG